MANLLSKLFSAGASNLVEAVGNAIDKNVTNDEERLSLENEIKKANLAYEKEMRALDIEEAKALLADTDSARQNQTRIQESANASWLSKNVHSFLALAIIGLTFSMYFSIIWFGTLKANSEMKDIIIYILGALTTISTQVVAYYFGSSMGSKDKQRALTEINTRLK